MLQYSFNIVVLRETIEVYSIILYYTKLPQIKKKIVNLSVYLWVYVYVFLTILLISSLLVITTLLIVDMSSIVSLPFYWVSSNLLRVKKTKFDSESPKFVCVCAPVCWGWGRNSVNSWTFVFVLICLFEHVTRILVSLILCDQVSVLCSWYSSLSTFM